MLTGRHPWVTEFEASWRPTVQTVLSERLGGPGRAASPRQQHENPVEAAFCGSGVRLESPSPSKLKTRFTFSVAVLLLVAELGFAGVAEADGPSALPAAGPSSPGIAQGPLFQDGTYLVIDVTPPDAAVYLDGRWLGKAETLSRGQIPILPGKRTIKVVRPGYRAYVAEFIARPVGIPTRLRIVLVPD